jgi:two-component system OmpR family response regulator
MNIPDLTESPERLKTVLIVEDNLTLAEEMAEALGAYGIKADVAGGWWELMERMKISQPDLILLDQRLGEVNALHHLAELRTKVTVPILVVTANREEVDRVIGLELGADDCLLKPISGRELAARVRAHLRRDERRGRVMALTERDVPSWKLSEVERRLRRPDGSVVDLTAAELDLLVILARRPGEAVSRADLTRQIFKREYQAQDRSMDALIFRLRRKICRDNRTDCIVSVRNGGYVFVGFP